MTSLVLLALSTLAVTDSVSINDESYGSGSLGVAPTQSFVSSPLQPPQFNIRTPATGSASDNYTFIAYRGTAATQPAPQIFDNNGSLVWSGQDFGQAMDFKAQTLFGERVLTFFNGSFYSGGYGYGHWEILGSNYSVIRSVDALNQTADTTDFHEFLITPNNTGLVESWRTIQADLSALGGPSDGWTWDCVFQEIDIASNELLFEWRSLEHVPVEQTYFAISNDDGSSEDNAFDYCHINSVEKDSLGNYLVSMRGPSTIYYIDGQTSEVRWELGGKSSSFDMGEGATFWYQHDARFRSDSSQSVFNVSLFDNAAGGDGDEEPTARAIMVQLNMDTMEATLVWEHLPSFNTTAPSQGNTQILSNGNVFVGWGAIPYFSEYTQEGELVHDVQFGYNSSVQSYRAFKLDWQGAPTTKPSVAVNSTAAAVSWNGATEVAQWALLGGRNPLNLSIIANSERTGFETIMAHNGSAHYVAVAAVSSNGTCIGVSNVYNSEVYYATNSSDTGTAGTCPPASQLGSINNGTAGSSSSDGGSSTDQPSSSASTSRVAVVLLGLVGLTVMVI